MGAIKKNLTGKRKYQKIIIKLKIRLASQKIWKIRKIPGNPDGVLAGGFISHLFPFLRDFLGNQTEGKRKKHKQWTRKKNDQQSYLGAMRKPYANKNFQMGII